MNEDINKRNINAFLVLVRAGLWEKVNENPNENLFKGLGWGKVQKLAEEQSVVGLVAAGFEKLTAYSLPLTEKLTLLGKCQLIEQRNEAMNRFIADLMTMLQEAGINAVLVKGQGVARCYEKPLWRACGDVDLLLNRNNYEKGKAFLTPLASHVDPEDRNKLHQGMTISQWTVELHGALHVDFSKRIDAGVDEVQRDIIENNGVRNWNNGDVDIQLPNANIDALVIFTHFIEHFYVGGVGVRQVCDWCRLLWTYREEIDRTILEERLRKMGLMTEWKGFAAFTVEYLGMPVDAMPLYENTSSYRRKACRLCELILETGDLGHNKNEGYRGMCSKTTSNIITFFRRFGEFAHIAAIFPFNSPRFFVTYIIDRIKAVA